jgi:cation transport protein ChaC
MPSNAEFLGPDSMGAMARQIATSVGPSGSNKDYLSQLRAILQEHNINDQHVFDLHQAVQAIIDKML